MRVATTFVAVAALAAGLTSASPVEKRQAASNSTSASASASKVGSASAAAASGIATSLVLAPKGSPTAAVPVTPSGAAPPSPSTGQSGQIVPPDFAPLPAPAAQIPYSPVGGRGTNLSGPPPIYATQTSFDFQSINLALNQEWIELDLFHYGLAKFSVADFEAAGLNAEDRYLIQFMADQEVGHATVLSNMLGANAAKRCQYQYPNFNSVLEFVDFCQKLTRFGESGVYGFLPHLDNGAVAQILLQSIATEARQQMIFRQFEGLFPMPVYFEVGIPQSWAWTLLAPYLASCPEENPHIQFQNFPALYISNQPSAIGLNGPAITHNLSTPLSYPGREVNLTWDAPGKSVSYNTSSYSYVTNTTATGPPAFAAWNNQYNVTYTALYNIKGNSASTLQPNAALISGANGIVNGTTFVAIVDKDVFVTPFNNTALNAHIVAGPALYQSG